MIETERQEPSDDELVAVARAAQERRAREVGEPKPMITASDVFKPPKIALVSSRGARCPSCSQLCSPTELVADHSKCTECRQAIERRSEKAIRERRAMLEKIPPVYRGDPPWSRDRVPPFLSEDVVRRSLEWLVGRSSRLSIFGEQTGSGKSTLAAFVALAGIEAGHGWEWVHASDLIPDHEVPEQAKEAVRICRTAPRVVVDGCGKELRGHDPTSGWARRKQEWLHALFGRAHESTTQRFVFTFDMGIDRFLEMNGNDASLLRRVAPDDGGKTVITLHRQGLLRIAKGSR